MVFFFLSSFRRHAVYCMYLWDDNHNFLGYLQRYHKLLGANVQHGPRTGFHRPAKFVTVFAHRFPKFHEQQC